MFRRMEACVESATLSQVAAVCDDEKSARQKDDVASETIRADT